MGFSTEVRQGPRAATRGLLLLLVFATVRGATEEPTSRVSPLAAPRGSGSRGLFAPRVEYDEWTPLGHGDPLKNDPTYDYVPPVLERVRYWIEPPSRAPAPSRLSPTLAASSSYTHTYTSTHTHPHTTFLQTSATSLDSRRDTYPFLTLVDAPKFNHPISSASSQQQQQQQQTIKTPESPQYLPSRPHFTVPPPPYKTIVTSPPQILTPAPSRAPMTVTTTASALTTDPLFAHYKQPAEPLRGPMYLIIEGHSKVKTYGATKTIHGIRVNEQDSRRQKRRRRRRKLRKRSLTLL